MTLSAVAFVPYPAAGASARYRVYQLTAELARLGVRLEVRPFFDERAFAMLYRPGGALPKAWHLLRGAAVRWGELAAARRFDVALVHRELWPLAGTAALERLVRQQPRWVYDFDDAVWLPNVSAANRRFAMLKGHGQHAILASLASAISAGIAWLAAWARELRPGLATDSVAMVPTPVDTVRWSPRPRAAGPPRLVWIGSHSTAHYLEPLRATLAMLSARHPGLELHVIGGRFAAPGVRVIEHEWSLEHETDWAAQCDIGLAPLPDDAWSRGKCGLKLLLYMALGLPAVASPVGVHSEMVRDGVNGRLADDPEAFGVALDQLLRDPDQRRQLGAQARLDVEREYSIAAVAPGLAALLTRAAS